MPGRTYCCIQGCRTNRKKLKKKGQERIPSIFSTPIDQEMLKEWNKAVGRELTKRDKVCELHFTEDKITKFFETVLTDGTVWRMKKIHPTLVKGAIPTIFTDLRNPKEGTCPSDTNTTPNKETISLEENLENREYPSDANTAPNKRTISLLENPEIRKCPSDINTTPNKETISSEENPDCEKTPIECRNDINNPKYKSGLNNGKFICEPLTYDKLASNLELVRKPSSLWGVTVQDEVVVCAKWDEDSTLMKRVIIDCNLKIQVFFKNRPVDFDNLKISYLKDLCSILKEVDSCGICINVDSLETAGCDGYILPDSQSNLCDYCLLTKNLEVSRRKDFQWLSKAKNFTKHQTLYERIHDLSRRNAHLKKEMNKIINIKAVWKLTYHKKANENLRK